MSEFNANAAPVEYDATDPEGYRSGMNRFGAELGAERIGGSVYELPPGQSICPYHYEHGCEEWLLVLSGTPTLRTPAGEQTLQPGDLRVFAEGPQGAHKVTNRADSPARVLMISNVAETTVAVYPDSGKIGVWPGRGADSYMFRPGADLDYFDGEPGVGPGSEPATSS